MVFLSGFFNKIGELLAESIFVKKNWPKIWLIFFIVLISISSVGFLTFRDTIRQNKNYIFVFDHSAYKEFESLLTTHDQFKELVLTWENLKNNTPSSESARFVIKHLQNYVLLYSRLDYELLKPYPTNYAFALINSTIVFTIAAIHYNDEKMLQRAKDKFEQYQKVRNDTDFKINGEWIVRVDAETKMSGFEIHWKTYEAILATQPEVKEKLKQEVAVLLDKHGGIDELIRNEKLLNFKTIENLTILGLYTPQ